MDRLTKAFIILAAVGIAVAVYHAYGEITFYSSPITSICNVNSYISCGSVFESGYDDLGGIPMWVFGVVWFPLMLALGIWFSRRRGGMDGAMMVPILVVGDVFTL